jgi:hypothetical protein
MAAPILLRGQNVYPGSQRGHRAREIVVHANEGSCEISRHKSQIDATVQLIFAPSVHKMDVVTATLEFGWS